MNELEKRILLLLRREGVTLMSSDEIARHLDLLWAEVAGPLLKLRDWGLVRARLYHGLHEQWWAVE